MTFAALFAPPYKPPMPLIAPSILAADLGRLAEEVRNVEAAGADWIHIDIMDGHFVPNLTMGPDIVRAVRRVTSLPLDVHLMVTNPLAMIEAFAAAGADYLSVHVEVVDDVEGAFRLIESFGKKPALVVNPDTPVEAVSPHISRASMILVMSVYPGFAGQKFIPEVLSKLEALRDLKKRYGSSCLLEIDGGIKTSNTATVVRAGAEVVVAGSGIFATSDYGATIAEMKSAS
jgi:ribulose-phosphate 3-epimerase